MKRNAREFFDQVKKAGGRSESEEARSETSDDSTDNVDELDSDTEALFGYAGPDEDDDDEEPEPDIQGARIVIPANPLGKRRDGIDLRPAVKVDDVMYQVCYLVHAFKEFPKVDD